MTAGFYLFRVCLIICVLLSFSAVFEAWMVSEHKSRRYPDAALPHTFSIATFGNGVVAIVAGLSASVAAQWGGYVAPFMVSMVVLIVSFFVIAATWGENYGDSQIDVAAGFKGALEACQDSKVWLLGLTSSLFEASMYSFVFMWSPVLIASVPQGQELPFGIIFASFMVCIMVGSSLFSIALRKGFSAQSALRASLILATASLSAPLWTSDWQLLSASFLCFEVACGLYFPAAGTLRGRFVPERQRSAVMNLFRFPLNLLVVAVLLNVDNMATSTVFYVIFAWMLIALVAQHALAAQAAKHDAAAASAKNTGEEKEEAAPTAH